MDINLFELNRQKDRLQSQYERFTGLCRNIIEYLLDLKRVTKSDSGEIEARLTSYYDYFCGMLTYYENNIPSIVASMNNFITKTKANETKTDADLNTVIGNN